ncbi:MAG: DUF2806 domain-containing protein [Deltaproteobacteria bacterium]|nr:MAG: DUF2806 domain-containing protein [Deltaproteobacteria bacterium]
MESWINRQVAKAQVERSRVPVPKNTEIEIAGACGLARISGPDGDNPIEGPVLTVQRLAQESLADTPQVVEQRIEQRILLRETRRQQNLESIVLGAAKEMPDEVSAEAVDDAWAARFFMDAQDVSDPKLQRLWSKILAREVAAPRTTSLRTLETLRNLSASEARLFEESLRYVCEIDNEFFFIHFDGMHFQVALADCGLIGMGFTISVPDGDRWECRHGDIKIVFVARESNMGFSWHISAFRLSQAGGRIAHVCRGIPDTSRDLLEGLSKTYEKHFAIQIDYLGRSESVASFLARHPLRDSLG